MCISSIDLVGRHFKGVLPCSLESGLVAFGVQFVAKRVCVEVWV